MKCKDIPEKVKNILSKLMNSGYEAYVVGGAVRDLLLNNKVNDYDITTNALPEQVKEVFYDVPVIETGLKHGTVTVIINHEPFEITTYRIEGDYLDNRRPSSVEFSNSLEEDLSRRDLTINALALDINGNIIDYFNGVSDLNNRIIKCVGDPTKRFNEDGLRILRALRFSSKLDFEIEEKTSNAILENINLINNISKERIQKELNGLLISKYTNRLESIILKYFDLFKEIIPELEYLNINQNNKYHKHNLLLSHTLTVLKNVDADLELRLAALFHDIGKANCYSEEVLENGLIQGHFYGHPKESAYITKKIMKELRYSNEEIANVEWLIEYHDFEIGETKRSVKRILNKCHSVELFEKLLKLKDADRKDHINLDIKYHDYVKTISAIKDEIIEEEAAFSLKQLKINGKDVMTLGLRGKEIGDALSYALEGVIEEKVKNEKDQLLIYIKNRF